MDYLPSKKFFYILFGIVFVVAFLFVLKFFAKSDISTVKEQGQVQALAGSSDSQPVPLWLRDDTSTSTLIAKALYYDNLLESTSTALIDTARNAVTQEIIDDQAKILGDQYSLTDLHISNDTGTNAFINYGNAVGMIIKKYGSATTNTNELTIVKNAIGGNDPASLRKLDPFVDFYKNVINDLLAMPVPKDVSAVHLHLINAYSSLLLTDLAFQGFTDNISPSVAAFNSYPDIAKKFINAFKEFNKFFADKGLIFSEQDRSYHLVNSQ